MSDKKIKVWVHPTDATRLLVGWPMAIHSKKDGYRGRIRATLIIPGAKKRKAPAKARRYRREIA